MHKQGELPRLYCFLDESYADGRMDETMRVAAFAITQDLMKEEYKRLISVFTRRRASQLPGLLTWLHQHLSESHHFVSCVKLDQIYPHLPGHIFHEDVGLINTRSEVFAHAAGQTMIGLLTHAADKVPFGQIDIFHDPISLSPPLKAQFDAGTRSKFAELLTDQVAQRRRSHTPITVDRIREVTKPTTGPEGWTELETGVQVAHLLANRGPVDLDLTSHVAEVLMY